MAQFGRKVCDLTLEELATEEMTPNGYDRDDAVRRVANKRARDKGHTQHRLIQQSDLVLALRMAAAMTLFKRPDEAAQFIGLDIPDSEAKDLARLARARWKGVLEGDDNAMKKLLFILKVDHLAASLGKAHTLSGRDMANAFKALTSAEKDLFGDSANVEGVDIVLKVTEPKKSKAGRAIKPDAKPSGSDR